MDTPVPVAAAESYRVIRRWRAAALVTLSEAAAEEDDVELEPGSRLNLRRTG